MKKQADNIISGAIRGINSIGDEHLLPLISGIYYGAKGAVNASKGNRLDGFMYGLGAGSEIGSVRAAQAAAKNKRINDASSWGGGVAYNLAKNTVEAADTIQLGQLGVGALGLGYKGLLLGGRGIKWGARKAKDMFNHFRNRHLPVRWNPSNGMPGGWSPLNIPPYQSWGQRFRDAFERLKSWKANNRKGSASFRYGQDRPFSNPHRSGPIVDVEPIQ